MGMEENKMHLVFGCLHTLFFWRKGESLSGKCVYVRMCGDGVQVGMTAGHTYAMPIKDIYIILFQETRANYVGNFCVLNMGLILMNE